MTRLLTCSMGRKWEDYRVGHANPMEKVLKWLWVSFEKSWVFFNSTTPPTHVVHKLA